MLEVRNLLAELEFGAVETGPAAVVATALQQRLEAETSRERDARQEHLKVLQQQRLEAETSQERDARLERLKVLQQQRLDAETSQERDARLNEMSTHQRTVSKLRLRSKDLLSLLEQTELHVQMAELFHR